MGRSRDARRRGVEDRSENRVERLGAGPLRTLGKLKSGLPLQLGINEGVDDREAGACVLFGAGALLGEQVFNRVAEVRGEGRRGEKTLECHGHGERKDRLCGGWGRPPGSVRRHSGPCLGRRVRQRGACSSPELGRASGPSSPRPPLRERSALSVTPVRLGRRVRSVKILFTLS